MVFAVNTPNMLYFLVLDSVLLNLLPLGLSASQVPCFFIFGDSLVDNGNNNLLNTQARVNYQPYGVDFPEGPTGRFTNGRNIADFLAKLLGFDNYIPPFATAQGNDILKGVNYGSGSAGIRNETGEQLGYRISLDTQLQNHNLTISRMIQIFGSDNSTKEYLGKCLYFFVIGSNDYLNNYYKPDDYSTSKTYTPAEYATVLVQRYSQQLTTLYKYGARKMAVSGIGPIGCTPAAVSKGTNGSICVDSMNNAVKLFNDGLQNVVEELNNNLSDAKFVYVSAMTGQPTAIVGPGLRLLGKPCCKVSEIGQCIPGETPCVPRALHAFYDNFHPSEIFNKLVAPVAYLELAKLDFLNMPSKLWQIREEIINVLTVQ